MARRPRCSDAGYVYHVLNRAVGRTTLFEKPADFAAFEKVLRESHEQSGMCILAYLVMPNHWHVLVWPDRDGQLSTWAQWLTVTHVRRWHAHHHTEGTGPLYQGRFKSFPIQQDDHYFSAFRYVERNALRANLVERAELWRWSSLWLRTKKVNVPWLSDGPLALPSDWNERVNSPETEPELDAFRRSVKRGTPLGTPTWQEQTATALKLESTLRPRGRPKKAKTPDEKET